VHTVLETVHGRLTEDGRDLALHALGEERGVGFVPQYLELLRSGGSRTPDELGRIVGVDLGDPGFWDGGLAIVEQQLEAAETAAAESGRVGN